MKEEIKNLRIKCDGLAQLTKELKPIKTFDKTIQGKCLQFPDKTETINCYNYNNSKEIEKTVDSLYLGKAWLGKLLGELGNENPYGSGYKTKEDIIPTQDTATLEISLDLLTHIEKVDWLRTEIEKVAKELSTFNNEKLTFKIYKEHSFKHLCEARFWLGFELERVRKSDNQEKPFTPKESLTNGN